MADGSPPRRPQVESLTASDTEHLPRVDDRARASEQGPDPLGTCPSTGSFLPGASGCCVSTPAWPSTVARSVATPSGRFSRRARIDQRQVLTHHRDERRHGLARHLFVSRSCFAIVRSAGSANRLVPPFRQMLECPHAARRHRSRRLPTPSRSSCSMITLGVSAGWGPPFSPKGGCRTLALVVVTRDGGSLPPGHDRPKRQTKVAEHPDASSTASQGDERSSQANQARPR
jgi:hypothetical protein